MPRRIKTFALFAAFVSLLALPVLAERTFLRPAWNLFSPQQDAEMGRYLADEAERNFDILNQPNANAYIDALGKQLSSHAPGPGFQYQFKIVNDDNINAWALPGGFVYVTSGLIDAAQNEPQLAGALAHQIAHITLRHGTADVSTAYGNQGANAARGRVSVRDAMSRLNIHFDNNTTPLKFTREEERQADVVATQIMYDTNFDPQQMTEFFQRVNNDRSNRTAEFFESHPSLPNLAATVRTELRNIGPLPRTVRGDSPDFHSVKDRHLSEGATNFPATNFPATSDRDRVYGDRPEFPSTRTAWFQGRDIEFRHPDNWRVSDQGDSISVAPDRGWVSGSLAYGMTIATFDPRDNRYFGRNSFSTQRPQVNNTTLANATQQLINHLQQSNPNMRVVRNSGRMYVDGAQAMVVELTNDSPAGGAETDRLITVLRPNGLLRYFVGVAPKNEFSRYQAAFDAIVNSARFSD